MIQEKVDGTRRKTVCAGVAVRRERMAACGRPSILVWCILSLLAICSSGRSIHGRIARDEARLVHVTAHSRTGDLAESTPVAPDGNFTMHRLHDGVYTLSVVGAASSAYRPLHVHVKEGVAVAREVREDPLVIPGVALEELPANASYPLDIEVLGKMNYLNKGEPWSIRSIIGNRFMMLQIFAVGFVILFPRYLKTLDKETLAELTGEVEPDIGDPNETIRALAGADLGGDDADIVRAIPSR